MKRSKPGQIDSSRSQGDAKMIGAFVERLMAQRGYAQVFAIESLQGSVIAAIGPALARSVTVGNLKAGVLQIHATDSVTLQELTFSKRAILNRIQQDHPQSKVRDLRFQVTTAVGG